LITLFPLQGAQAKRSSAARSTKADRRFLFFLVAVGYNILQRRPQSKRA